MILIKNKKTFEIIKIIIQLSIEGMKATIISNNNIEKNVSILVMNKKLLLDLKGIFKPVNIVVKKDSTDNKNINTNEICICGSEIQ
jgi:hypothetical protein